MIWEDRYQAGDTPWDKGEASPPLIDYLAEHPLRGTILVPGCGYGYDVRAIATKANSVVGIDIAPSAIAGARKFPPAAREEYQLADLFELDSSFENRFDWVWEHTCFCAIDPERRGEYVSAVSRVLKPGGHILAVFYLDPGQEGDGPPFGVHGTELDALFKKDFQLLQKWIPKRAYPGREGREEMRLLKAEAT